MSKAVAVSEPAVTGGYSRADGLRVRPPPVQQSHGFVINY